MDIFSEEELNLLYPEEYEEYKNIIKNNDLENSKEIKFFYKNCFETRKKFNELEKNYENIKKELDELKVNYNLLWNEIKCRRRIM